MKKFPIDFLEPYEKSSKQLNVVVETPKGSRVKYSYDEKKGMYIISKALPEGMVFPFNFGFVPGTLAADGDPLDMLILNRGTGGFQHVALRPPHCRYQGGAD